MQKDHACIVTTNIILFLFKHNKRFPKTEEKLQNFMQKYEEQNFICKCMTNMQLSKSGLISYHFKFRDGDGVRGLQERRLRQHLPNHDQTRHEPYFCQCNKINNTQNGQQLPSLIQFSKPNIFQINFRSKLGFSDTYMCTSSIQNLRQYDEIFAS